MNLLLQGRQFVLDHFLVIWCTSFACTIAYGAWQLRKRRIHGPHFPDRSGVTVVFEEKWASGRSFKSWFTRFGGANNCLRVTLTSDELWITPHFPFSAFGKTIDLDHRIELTDLINVERRRKSVVRLEFVLSDEPTRIVELRLRKMDEFLAALTRSTTLGQVRSEAAY